MRIALALLALLLAAPAGADGLLLSGEGDRIAVDLAPDDLQPGLSVYDTSASASGHRWVVPADPPRESSAGSGVARESPQTRIPSSTWTSGRGTQARSASRTRRTAGRLMQA